MPSNLFLSFSDCIGRPIRIHCKIIQHTRLSSMFSNSTRIFVSHLRMFHNDVFVELCVGRQYFVNLDDTVAQKVSSLGFTSYCYKYMSSKNTECQVVAFASGNWVAYLSDVL